MITAVRMDGGTPRFVDNLPRAVKFLRLLRRDLHGSSRISGDELEAEGKPTEPANNKKVFIVHGHDEALKQSVARTMKSLGLSSYS